MRRHSLLGTIFFATSLVYGCAEPGTQAPVPATAEAAAEAQKQKEIAFRSHTEDIIRLLNIGDRLEIGAAPLCGDRAPNLGWTVANAFSFPVPSREIANAQFALGNRLKIIRIMPDGPTARAGIAIGDEIATINGAAVEGEDAAKRFNEVVQATVQSRSPIRFGIVRNGRPMSLDIASVSACNFPLFLVSSEKINAMTNGRLVVVSDGMVRFARNDTELAAVIAHEMSHDIRNHVEAQRENEMAGRSIGLLLDILAGLAGVHGSAFSNLGASIGRGHYSQEFEAEADYVSLYVMVLSGYDITHAPDIWRRMATVNPDDIEKGYTHPSSAERFVAMEAAVREIQKKQAEGAILRPEEKTKEEKQEKEEK